jgi:hypothetical protein
MNQNELKELEKKISEYEELQPHQKTPIAYKNLKNELIDKKKYLELQLMEINDLNLEDNTLLINIAKVNLNNDIEEEEKFKILLDRVEIIKEEMISENIQLDQEIELYKELQHISKWINNYIREQKMLLIDL